MHPKKYKEFIPIVAEESNVNQQLVNDLVNFYWKDIRKMLSGCEAHNIIVNGLGTFKIRPWKIKQVKERYEETINRYKTIMDSGQKVTLQKFSMVKEAENRLAKINNIERMLQEDEQKRKQVIKKRYDKESDEDME